MEPTLTSWEWASMQGREAGRGIRLVPKVSSYSQYFICPVS